MTITGRIGTHVSIAGGVQNAPSRAAAEGCETFQCFTRSPQGGPAPALTEDVLNAFKGEMAKAGIDRFYIHSPYYINLASLEGRIYHSSIKVLREELERGSLLGARYVMAHPGSYKDQTLEQATEKVRDAIDKILNGYTGSCQFLVEISAGAGNVLGDTFQEVADMIDRAKGQPGFGGVCFDTCHAFGSGYDYRTPEKARAMLKEFDKYVGLEYLKLSHVQDSKVDLGGKRDRHEHIGDGFVSEEGLASLLQTPEFQAIDWLLETPHDKVQQDIEKLKNIRG